MGKLDRQIRIACRLLALLCCAALLGAQGAGPARAAQSDPAGAPSAAADAALPAGYTRVAENEALRLYVDERLTVILEDRRTGERWRSAPEGAADDELAREKIRQQMQSAMLVSWLNASGAVEVSSSFTSSVKKNAAVMKTIDGGFRVEYTFPKEGFTIPVEFVLDGEALRCRVLADRIVQTGENRVQAIELLPYFGAGGAQDTGYLFVPDGSGALIRFGNGKTDAAPLDLPVYGRDVNFDLIRSFSNTEAVRLPVFGICRGGSSLLAVIDGSPAAASVRASVAGRISSYNTVCCAFTLLASDQYTMGETVGSRVKQVTIRQEGSTTYGTVGVSFYPLADRECSGYAAMAARYRRRLIEEEGIEPQKTDPGLYVSLLCAVRKKQPVFGIPFTVTQKITGYDAAGAAIRQLTGDGADDLTVLLERADGASVAGRPPAKLTALSALGGKSGLRRLLDTAEECGATVAPDTEWLKVEKWGSGYFSLFHAAKTISGNHAQTMPFDIATRFKDKTRATSLLRPARLAELGGKLGASLDRWGMTAVGTGELGRMLYSDFSSPEWNRQKSAEAAAQAAGQLREGGRDVLVFGGNSYLLAAASAVLDTPDAASGYDIADESVPFYALVMNGLRPCAGGAVNLSDDPRAALLTAIATGSSLYYRLYDDADGQDERLQDTAYTALYNARLSEWTAKAAGQYRELKAALAPAAGTAIADYVQLSPGVSRTVYENGTVILVNATDKETNAGGTVLGGMSYTVVKGGDGDAR